MKESNKGLTLVSGESMYNSSRWSGYAYPQAQDTTGWGEMSDLQLNNLQAENMVNKSPEDKVVIQV